MKTKLLFVLLSFVLLATDLLAQDIITKKNGDELKVKVIEISETQIKYKNYSNLNGPLYNISKTEVFMIKYENGEKDVFTSQTQPSNTTTTPSQNITPQQPPTTTLLKLPLRESFNFGAKFSAGVGGLGESSGSLTGNPDDNLLGFYCGFGAFADYIFKRSKPKNEYFLIGTRLHYAYSTYSESSLDFSFDQLHWDAMVGVCSKKFKDAFGWQGSWIGRGGIRTSFMLGADMTYRGYTSDIIETCNTAAIGLAMEVGYSWRYIEVGLEFSRMFSNILNSGYYDGAYISCWGFGFVCAVRF